VTAPPTATTATRGRFAFGVRRSREDRIVSGLAAGIAVRIGIGPIAVRAAFAVLTAAGGVGVLLYLVGWLAVPEATEDDDGVVAPPADGMQRIALAMIFLGILVALRALNIWFNDAAVVIVALVSFGFAFLWERTSTEERTRWTRLGAGDTSAASTTPSRWRIVVGAVLLIAGLSAFFSSLSAVSQFGEVLLAALVTAAGLLLVFGPWIWRLAAELASERRERIRSEERSDMAAHLHDSVLQTLALIQRSDDPRQMATLARAQERELRAWLYGGQTAEDGADLEQEVERMAARIEQVHHVPVEVVTVGSAEVDERLRALVAAGGEAATNAAKHSGAGRVSVYTEVGPERVELWVSDQGAGFDAAAVPPDRRGIADSIVGRMERHGGTAEIESGAEGTEVHLTMPMNGGSL
jgi:signal transduction histidine kinase/phage shock protein PspC (stress-responsive transcriptional regulator)